MYQKRKTIWLSLLSAVMLLSIGCGDESIGRSEGEPVPQNPDDKVLYFSGGPSPSQCRYNQASFSSVTQTVYLKNYFQAGDADYKPAFERAMQAQGSGKILRIVLDAGVTYDLRNPVALAISNMEIRGASSSNKPTIRLLSGSGFNVTDSNNRVWAFYSDGKTKIKLEYVKFDSSYVNANNYVGAVRFQNSNNVAVFSSEFTGFKCASGIVRFDHVNNADAVNNYIHDSSVSTGACQLTGITVDEGGYSSYNMRIALNSIWRLKRTDNSEGWQTDGINVAPVSATQKPHDICLYNNDIREVGDGIDVGGQKIMILQNYVQEAQDNGLKMPHGANYCAVYKNTLKARRNAIELEPGYYGDIQYNEFAYNTLRLDTYRDCSGCTRTGIALRPVSGQGYRAQYNRFFKNNIAATTGSPNYTYGYQISSGANVNSIREYDYGSSFIYDASTKVSNQGDGNSFGDWIHSAGESCSDNKECESNSCSSGTCVKNNSGGICHSDAQCSSGACLDASGYYICS